MTGNNVDAQQLSDSAHGDYWDDKSGQDMANAPPDKLDEILNNYLYKMNLYEESDKMQDSVRAETKGAINQLRTQDRQEVTKTVIALGHNHDCIFCGLKDKVALKTSGCSEKWCDLVNPARLGTPRESWFCRTHSRGYWPNKTSETKP